MIDPVRKNDALADASSAWPRSILICHAEDAFDREGLSRWLSSYTELVGIIVIHEKSRSLIKRSRREIERSGLFRFLLDVVPFRIFYRLTMSARDRRWLETAVRKMKVAYPELREDLPMLHVSSPNSAQAKEFIEELKPDIMIARCKFILRKKIFSIPTHGTFVLHPGICPEYRNAHGCFWAMANGQLDKVGMTLLQIDSGVDTGPIYGHYYCDFDIAAESHIALQYRVVLENLDVLADKITEMAAGRATPVDVSGRASGVWGQPWLSRYFAARMKRVSSMPSESS